jgi:hypothetical protein
LPLVATLVVACPSTAPAPLGGAVDDKRVTSQEEAAAPGPPAPPRQVDIAEMIYDGELKNGWQDWGWAPRHTGGGPATVRFDNWNGWILAKPGLQSTDYGGLTFRVQEPPGEGEFVEVRFEGRGGTKFPRVKVRADERVDVGGGWAEVLVPMSELNPDGEPFERVVFQPFRPMGTDFIPIDKVGLVKGAARPAASLDLSKLNHVAMSVDCRSRVKHISPGIYGIASSQPVTDEKAAVQWTLGATGRRWGGNPTTTYNWETGAWNVGVDWFFENLPSQSYQVFLADNVQHGVDGALTVPMIGWVAKDQKSNSFPVSSAGPQAATDQWRPEAGNGKDKNGKEIPAGPQSRAYVPAPPEFIKRWVQTMRADDAKRGGRGVKMYILDNEPALWNINHRDAHPDPVTYDELVKRTIDYASAIREADPNGLIAGPAEWGWLGYFYSAKDNQQGGPSVRVDRRAHGDVPLVAYYLKALADYERKTGKRIFDVLDLHAYPTPGGVYGDAADSGTAALRLRTTRMLWDPGYVDESWIKEPIKLIPRMRQWVDENYPGRALSIGEWNFGAENHISGALAIAEVFGRFAQEGLDYAYYWTFPPEGSPAAWAFRAYRNFNGRGGRFQDWYTPTTLPDGLMASLFASRDDTGGELVAIALNLSRKEAIAADIDLSSCGKVASQEGYGYEGSRDGFTTRTLVAGGGKISMAMPPYSMTVIDVHLDGASPLVK